MSTSQRFKVAKGHVCEQQGLATKANVNEKRLRNSLSNSNKCSWNHRKTADSAVIGVYDLRKLRIERHRRRAI